jgi:hypothetical protein
MKFPLVMAVAFAVCIAIPTDAQEMHTPPADTVASIPVPVHDGTPSLTPPPVEKPDFQIEATQIKEIDVVEAPPMPGLPPVEGTIRLTVHSVADPGLPDPPPPSAPPESFVSETPELLSEEVRRQRQTRFAFVSATVHEGPRTHLSIYPSGGRNQFITVWSNLDFHHFTGFGTFEARDGGSAPRIYHLLLGVHSENAELRRQYHAKHGLDYKEPEIPNLPDGAPAFVIETENPDPETLTLINDLHALYRSEGTRMAKVHIARREAEAARRAHYLANPPKPKDVTIQFWNRQP